MNTTLIHKLKLNKKGIISLIGAGGKTSLMFLLAKELADAGKKVLTTTTTKIFVPQPDVSPTIVTNNFKQLVEASKLALNTHNHFSAGSFCDTVLGKLIGFDPDVIDDLFLLDLFDWIIVEADGAKQKPVKTTDSHEPVLPKATSTLILVTGLDAVGTVLNEKNVHRAALFSKNTGLALGNKINERSIAESIAVETRKAGVSCSAETTFVFLNKADTPERINSGKRIAGYLQSEKDLCTVFITALQDREGPVKDCFTMNHATFKGK